MVQNLGQRPVFFFDIDNCLYPRSKRVHECMSVLIDKYFMTHLSLSAEDATRLHNKYYREYGLAIEGLVRHHKIDPLDYNSKVDDALPLDDIITPDPQLRKLLEDIDKSKVRLWLLTNAYITHGQRVVKLLGVDDMFEGITFCDYGAERFVCKPDQRMFAKAQAEAGVSNAQECYFVDDSHLNCRHAQALGWTTAHLLDPSDPDPATRASKYQIRSLEELRTIFPQFFKSTAQVEAQPVSNGSETAADTEVAPSAAAASNGTAA
ncbi:pyrimidine 5-nucleotidase [Xylona heveae TC161]|uniref:Pyrimidine 5-nucleotidase n=1 Tax=Xylona heveae (strain CBS 132557 / TC161) TaxID=1328760 RepID=A0A165HG65_XYLHT|nr:pyrimidine 5-nucleotidase [Xylona heveae TC161]KZF23460.1 pyrimidine 5-nucleotidase [Xylona heveae TC161]